MNTMRSMKRQIALVLFFVAVSARSQTTIILVRHAERASQEADSLSDAGFARARELARVLASANVGAIYATQFRRTQQTAAPLAHEYRLTPIVIKTGDTYAHEVVADVLAHHAGQIVVVVSHSDRIPSLLQELGIAKPPAIPMTEYDDLFICTSPKLLILRYGVPAR